MHDGTKEEQKNRFCLPFAMEYGEGDHQQVEDRRCFFIDCMQYADVSEANSFQIK